MVLIPGVLKQYLAGCTASLALMIQGTALGWPSPTLVVLKETGNPMRLTDEETSWMVSLLYIGNILSPIPSGFLMDIFGRKKALLYLTSVPLAAWVLVLYAEEPNTLYVSRFLNGLWSGISYTIVPMYLGEISEPNVRGALSTFVQTMTYIGVFYEYAIGPFVSYIALGLMNTVVPVIFILIFFWMPESPYWYAMTERHTDAEKSLEWLRGASSPMHIREEYNKIEESVREQMQNKKHFVDLVATAGNRKGLIIVQVLSIFQRVSGISGLMAFTSITLPKEGMNPNKCVIIMGLVWISSVFISTALVDRLGRRPLLIASCLGTGISMAVASFWFFLRYKTDVEVYSSHWIPFACILIYGLFFSIGLGPIASTIQSEIFPSNTKGLASAVTTISLGLSSFIMNKTYLPIAQHIGMYFNFLIFSTASFICLFFVIFYVIETKNKTLYEIQEHLNPQRHKSSVNEMK